MKIIDSKLTTNDINNMSNREFKNFERRLRWRAQTQGYILSKSSNQFFGALYYIADAETNIADYGSTGLNIEEVRNWLYEI